MRRHSDVSPPLIGPEPPQKQRAMVRPRVPPANRDPLHILVLARDQSAGRSYVRAMEDMTLSAEWVRTMTELEARALGDGGRALALLMVVSAEHEETDPQALALLAHRLFADTRAPGRQGWRMHLHDAFGAYCSQRELSPRQERVLALYLRGNNDKEIAALSGCSESTIYEHWRRMARKADGYHKSDVVADFHRFLAGAGEHPDGPDAEPALAAGTAAHDRPDFHDGRCPDFTDSSDG